MCFQVQRGWTPCCSKVPAPVSLSQPISRQRRTFGLREARGELNLMSILWSGIKFLGLLFVLALVVNTIIRAVVTTLIADVFYRARLKREPSLSRITLGEPLGSPLLLSSLAWSRRRVWLG